MFFTRKRLIDYLHLFVLANFAVAQPLYDLLGKYAGFFVAHNAGSSAIIWTVVALSVFVPAFLALVEAVAEMLFGHRFRNIIHFGFTGILAGLVMIPPLTRWDLLPGPMVYLLVVISAGIFILLYVKWKYMRSFLTAMSPAVLIFPAYFLFFTPVKSLILKNKAVLIPDIKIKNKVPVILIVFDEFNTMALLDKNGAIDSVRYPFFAALASESYWFPNAVCASLQTLQSVPAILTGQKPSMENKKLAITAHHPNNLFSLLAGQYYFNVHESETSVCPDTLKKYARVFERSYFVSDIMMIYKVLLIHGIKNSSGQLEGRWQGFTNVPSQDKNRPPGTQNRKKQIKAFIEGLYPDKMNQLDFIHLTLPHVPYEFLSSGRSYTVTSMLPEGIISDETGWGNSVELVEVAWQRYLQQVGFTDKVLGSIIAALRGKGIYNESLIIITADHGVAMQPGRSRRSFDKGNQREIFKVPTFLKLPNQEKAEISNALVSGIDILPTIAAVLGIRLPWNPDGKLMISELQGKNAVIREKIEMPGLGEFGISDIEGFPSLRLKTEIFGSGTPLAELVRKDANHRLLGKNLLDIDIRSERHTLTAEVENIDQFKYIELRGEYLPALLCGHIVNAKTPCKPALAVALNGKIQATTTASQWMAEDTFFSVLLPEAAFQQGVNLLDIFMINKGRNSRDPYLVRIPVTNAKKITLRNDPSGSESLVDENGEEIPVIKQTSCGYLDNFLMDEYMIRITGWAFDKKEGLPVRSIVIFSGKESIAQTKPVLRRNDLVPILKTEKVRYSGFLVEIPIYAFTGEKIRAFAVTKKGTACELKTTGTARDSLEKFYRMKLFKRETD